MTHKRFTNYKSLWSENDSKHTSCLVQEWFSEQPFEVILSNPITSPSSIEYLLNEVNLDFLCLKVPRRFLKFCSLRNLLPRGVDPIQKTSTKLQSSILFIHCLNIIWISKYHNRGINIILTTYHQVTNKKENIKLPDTTCHHTTQC